jgi:replication factor A1
MDRLADRKQIIDIKNEGLGYKDPEKPDWLSFKGTFSFIKKDKEGGAWYTACANSGEPCKNRFKVEQLVDGNWQCQKCNCTYPNCVRRWIFSATVCDDTSTTWVSLFNEQAETLFGGVTADEVYNTTMGDVMDQDAYDSYFAKANHTEWIFKCKVKQEMVNDESRVKTSVVAMHPVDYVKESQDLLAAIEQF